MNARLESEGTYTNPFELPEEWEDYGIGDPYVLRHNGMYYLYCSTKDFQVGIKAWSSEDLIDWKYEGLVTEDDLTMSAYAPEVVYWNGVFYLYTSPAGEGHYVLTSESPTGPFIVRTENLGMSIDGSVFIDDDGTWYFTHAGDQGIVGRKMIDPFTFDAAVPTNAFLGHWTEGSMIIKLNNLYYMTYTGNHVFSKGYRINYAISEISPIQDYQTPNHNPILIKTNENFFGLGHNSIVLGPDLDSYYAVYHNLIGPSEEGPPIRKMNIDRFIFNGKRMDILGPTNYEMSAPSKPDYEIRNIPKMNGTGKMTWLSEEIAAPSFTAEYNFTIDTFKENGFFGTVFSYQDELNFGYVCLDVTSKKIKLFEVENGREQLIGEQQIDHEMDLTKHHTIRIEHAKDKIIVFLDGMKKIASEDNPFVGGRIGYYTHNVQPSIAYTAFSNHVHRSNDFEAHKPIPGSIEAVHFLEEMDRGYHVKAPTDSAVYRNNVPIRETETETYSVQLRDEEDWLAYKINVKEDGLYGISAILNPPSTNKNTILLATTGHGEAQQVKIPDLTAHDDTRSIKLPIGFIQLKKGLDTLKIRLKMGRIELERLELYRVSDEKIAIENGFENIKPGDIDGKWLQTETGYQSHLNEDMKLYIGNEHWTDIEAKLTFEIMNLSNYKAGLVMRVTNPSSFEHQVKDSLMGYYVSFDKKEMSLQKLNYDSTILKTAPFPFTAGNDYRIRVTVNAGELNVYVDGEKNPVLVYHDPNAFMYGKVGIRSEYSNIHFKKMSIQSLK